MTIYAGRSVARANVRPSARSSRSSWTISEIFVGAFLFAIGILSSIVIHFVGDVFIAEIAIVITIPGFILHSGRQLIRPRLIRLFALLAVWLGAQIISDAYNHTAFQDRMRGMALILLFTIEIAFFAMCVAGSERRKVIFLAGYAIGSIALTRLQPNAAAVAAEGGTAQAWKWAYSYGVTILALLMASLLASYRRRVLALLVLVGICAVDLLMNFRSAFLMLLVTIVLVFPVIPERIGGVRILPRKNNLLRAAIVALLAVAGGWSANKLVHAVSQAGLIGEEAQQKNESEAQAGNLLVGGRPEFFVGVRAAMDSPVIGHGSWAKEMRYIEMQHDMLQEYGIEHDLGDAEANAHGLIPAHSHIVAAWVFAGFLGMLFWVYVFWLVLRAIVAAVVQRPTLAPIYVWLLVGYSWNIFFSPFGSTSRIIEAFTLVVIVDLLERSPGRVSERSGWRRRGAAVVSKSLTLQPR